MDSGRVRMIQLIWQMPDGVWQEVKDPHTREDLFTTINFICSSGFEEFTGLPSSFVHQRDASGAIRLPSGRTYLYWST